jgi:hypothetical protein
MADTVTGPTILQQNDKRVVIKIVNQSDGSGGTTVFGDVSALDAREDGTAVAHLGLLKSLVFMSRWRWRRLLR